jgi:hypothetical protein
MRFPSVRFLAAVAALAAALIAVGSSAPQRALAASTPQCTPGPTLNCADLPLDFLTTNTCTGEMVNITGVYHVLVKTATSSSGTVTSSAYTNYQNARGVAVPSGTTYQANLTDHEYDRTDPLGATIDQDFDENYELISNAPTPNMLVHFRFHMHVDALGVPTVSIQGTDARCVG